MKLLTLILMAFMLISCGGDDEGNTAGSCQDSPFIGSWSGNIGGNPDTMTFQEDCTGESTYCGSVFTFPPTNNDQGVAEFNVSAMNGNSLCLPPGRTSCAYIVSGNSLEFTCGGDVLVYTKN